jgi:hypothetical protein
LSLFQQNPGRLTFSTIPMSTLRDISELLARIEAPGAFTARRIPILNDRRWLLSAPSSSTTGVVAFMAPRDGSGRSIQQFAEPVIIYLASPQR